MIGSPLVHLIYDMRRSVLVKAATLIMQVDSTVKIKGREESVLRISSSSSSSYHIRSEPMIACLMSDAGLLKLMTVMMQVMLIFSSSFLLFFDTFALLLSSPPLTHAGSPCAAGYVKFLSLS